MTRNKPLIKPKKEKAQKEFDNSLKKYAMVLSSSVSSRNQKMEALEGMRAIGSPESLPIIKKYLQKLNPVMWNYKEPDEELINAAAGVYLAVANNLAQTDREKAIKMMNHSFNLTRDFSLRDIATKGLKDLGTLPGKEFEIK